MITGTKLQQKLGVSRATITAWRKEGMPAEKVYNTYKYDPIQVREWLVEKGYAATQSSQMKPQGTGRVVQSKRECAAAFNVESGTVSYWLKHPDFPGVAGDSGNPGYYPIDEIAEWRRKKFSDKYGSSVKLTDVKTELLELKLKQEKGEILYKGDVVEMMTDVIQEIKNKYKGFAGYLLKQMPASYIELAIHSLPKDAANKLKKLVSEHKDVFAEVEEAYKVSIREMAKEVTSWMSDRMKRWHEEQSQVGVDKE